MKVQVQLFAAARELAGRSMIDVELSDNANVARLQAAVAEQYPTLAPLLDKCRLAVDSDYVQPHFAVLPNQEIALIPPVSGG